MPAVAAAAPGADRTGAVPAVAAYAVAEQTQPDGAERGVAEPEHAGAAGSAAARWEAARCCSVAAAWALLKAFSG